MLLVLLARDDGAGSCEHEVINNGRKVRGHDGAQIDFPQVEGGEVYRTLPKQWKIPIMISSLGDLLLEHYLWYYCIAILLFLKHFASGCMILKKHFLYLPILF